MSELITKALAILHPKGQAWMIPKGDFRKLLEGLAIEYNRQKEFVEGVLDESYPPAITETIEEWFKAFNIPYDPGYTLQQARDIITERWTSVGGQDIVYLQDQIDKAGFTNITIYEIIEPVGDDGSIVGESVVGAAECWNPDNLIGVEWYFHYLIVGTVDDRNALFRLFNIVDKICPYHAQPLYYVTWDMTFADRTPSGLFNQLFDVAYGNELWIAVGGGDASFSTSENGYIWDRKIISSIEGLRAIEYYNYLWMAVGIDGEVITSTDNGENWTQQTSGTTKKFYEIAYDSVNGIICVVGENGAIFVSKNFKDWFDYSISTSDDFVSIDHNGRDLFAAGGQNGMLYKSSNGQLWKSVTYPTSNTILKIKYAKYEFEHPNLWGIIESITPNAMHTTYDMINFKQQALTTGTNMRGADYNGKLWVFVGLGGTIYNSQG